MAITQIEYSSNFVKQFKKLTPKIQKQAIKAEKLFKKDPFSPTSKTHKLTGQLEGLWAFSINYKDRIIFEFMGQGKVLFHKIGSHDIYKL
ncbi:type II toxin-antitoxin system YoeB family toxin [Candidatus Daviesbacteria bacterium]|nr:type II toxin-antitoxin system YoeB family toxin [Candidatus Daviesbacteria bacterium]